MANCENWSDDENMVLFPFLLFIRLLFIKKIKELERALSGYGHISRWYNFRDA